VSEPLPQTLPSTLHATLHTNRGDIKIKLLPDHAPKTVRNFVELAEGGREWRDPRSGASTSARFYDGLTFHRVIAGFMIQGGCPLGTGTGGPGYDFDDEIHPELAFNRPYLLAMANSGKRMGKGTNGSQFFVTVVNTPHLQGKHTIFGEVADAAGRQVVDAIVATPTDRSDRPAEPVVINSVTVERG
jgi:peptidyl-prolyl cis-trans isomerase A (cyclophilin A)